jgi:hypothetical protein
MLLNHKEAIRYLVDGINRMEINIDNIRTLHYLLADGLILPEDAGQIRDAGVSKDSLIKLLYPIGRKTITYNTAKLYRFQSPTNTKSL